ncbi:MAG: protein-L-isoaspartate(D-aspartate) O-methyltransferase [Cyclobacteriaceae bacterium]|nr:protein-L-isoaspartate(D-aspartate) O-methyltransferase [Cyclobacteriaceae bacterium]
MLEDSYRHKGLRRKLAQTLKKKGIRDERIIRAIEKVPRHYFFDQAFLEHAYQDKAFPIGQGQTISQPFTVAFQTQLLEIEEGDKVLEIGTGSGYQACILLELGAEVFTIEYIRSLFQTTKAFLPRMGYNPHFFHGDGTKGLPAFAPFDKIIVTAAAPEVPKPLQEQLKTGGILVIPVGDDSLQKMMRIIKLNETEFREEAHDFFSFVPLVGKFGWKK